MIIKKIKTKILGKRREHQIGDLVDYIRMPHNRNEKEKILHAGSRNFCSNIHAGQKYEMVTLARESKHSEMPVTHWVISWPEDEHPTREHVEKLVDIFLKEMGLEGHQVIFGLHGNTQNIHLHIAVNRMNELTGTVARVNKGYDIIQAHKAIAVIENIQGWKPEKNASYKVVDGEVVKQKRQKTLQPSQAAQSFEQHTGIKSAERIAQENATHRNKLEQELKTASENKDVAQNDYNEKAALVLKLEEELRDVQNAYAKSPLGRELKRLTDLKAEQQRQEAERLQREQEEQRQREERERQERESEQERVEDGPKEDALQQYQASRLRMR